MPPNFFFPFVNYRWRKVLNSVLPGQAVASVVQLPVFYQKDPDRDDSYLVRLCTDVAGECIFVCTAQRHKISMPEWLETGGRSTPVV